MIETAPKDISRGWITKKKAKYDAVRFTLLYWMDGWTDGQTDVEMDGY